MNDYDVLETGNGTEGLEMAMKFNYDLLLLLTHVHYKSGDVFDMAELTTSARLTAAQQKAGSAPSSPQPQEHNTGAEAP